MVRAQMPPYKLLDIKNSLGSSIGLGLGVALSRAQREMEKRVVVLSGDSAFLHSGFPGLVDAGRMGVKLLVVILDNGTTALSGGQPHPATPSNARGGPQRTVDLAALARAAGAGLVRVVNIDEGEDMRVALEKTITYNGVAVVIARGRCVLW
jgi:indolepyruvate ferredoxin oxidoreductase alpha subunit